MKKVTSDIAYEYIRKRILSGEYPSGHYLLTENLSAEIGVSRTPIREALQRLVTDGLVDIRPRRGAAVKQMNLEEFREVCSLRLALEGYATMMAAQLHTPHDLREIKRALEALRVLTDQIIADYKDPAIRESIMREDVRFHIAIMTAAKSNLIKGEILRLHLVNRIVFGPLSPNADSANEFQSKEEHDKNRRRVLESHEEIFDAISRRDAHAARDAMERHIQDIIDRAAFAFESSVPATRELTEQESAYYW